MLSMLLNPEKKQDLKLKLNQDMKLKSKQDLKLRSKNLKSQKKSDHEFPPKISDENHCHTII